MTSKPKMGRPRFKKGEARTELIRIRVTPAEKQVIEAQSDNYSEWVRERVLAGLEIPGSSK